MSRRLPALEEQQRLIVRAALFAFPAALSVFGSVYLAAGLHTAGIGVFVDFDGNVMRAGRQLLGIADGIPDVDTAWPPTATLFVAPLALLPYPVAVALWSVASVGAFVVALRLVGCRDRAALAVAALSPPALACLVLGNVSLLLAAGVAVLWRYRDRPFVGGIAAGVVVAAKVWLWPLLLFFVFTRRWLSLAAATGWCAAGAAIWLAFNPTTFLGFPGVAERNVEAHVQWGTGAVSALVAAGASVDVAAAAALAAALVIASTATRTRSEVAILTICLAAALVASPLVWEHYYAVLFVPIAIVARQLSLLWFVPYLAGLKFLWPAITSLWPTTPVEYLAYSSLALLAAAAVTVAAALPLDHSAS